MLIQDCNGNKLLEIIKTKEDDNIYSQYAPLTHSLIVVKIGTDYLMGWNHWRNDWEIFGGCMEKNENIRECIIRECNEELGLEENAYTYIGLMKYDMAPGYFNPLQHIEYGALFGITLPETSFEKIKINRKDKDEIEKLAFYNDVYGKEKIAEIDEVLLNYWK